MNRAPHTPVMPHEVLAYLAPQPGETALDATLGGGGHAALIAERLGEKGYLIGCDWDEKMLAIAQAALKDVACRKRFIHSDYRNLKTELGDTRVGCALFDLGLSSMHLDEPERGFSFRYPDALLDMRMDRSRPETAAHLLERLSEAEIERTLRDYGEERRARAIARRIVERVHQHRMQTTGDLIEAVGGPTRGRIHPATRTFQALRIAVNGEIVGLEQAIADVVSLLNPNGRIVVIAFHSLEDRAVKRVFQRLSGKCVCPPTVPECRCGAQKLIEVLTKKPVVAAREELADNPRSRSAKLRAAKRLA